MKLYKLQKFLICKKIDKFLYFLQINNRMTTLIKKERYLFRRCNDSSYYNQYFRANYIDIVRNQIRVYHYEDIITNLHP
jgi:hypothetical protein